MNIETRQEQIEGSLQQSWQAVGGYLSTAMQEVALELGGEDLAERIAAAAASDEALPNPDALSLLEELHPGSAELVLSRSEEIQQDTHQRELDAIRKPSLRKYGKAILDGLASFTIFESSPRRRRR